MSFDKLVPLSKVQGIRLPLHLVQRNIATKGEGNGELLMSFCQSESCNLSQLSHKEGSQFSDPRVESCKALWVITSSVIITWNPELSVLSVTKLHIVMP